MSLTDSSPSTDGHAAGPGQRYDARVPATTWRAFDILIVLGLVALGWQMRREGLAPTSLYLDDAWVAMVARVPVADLGIVDFTTTGYTVGLKAWFSLVGFSELRAQIPMFAASILLAPVLFLALRNRIGRVGALVAAGCVLVSPVHIEFSVRIKQYTIEALLAALVLVAAWRIIDQPESRRRWIVFALLSLGAVATSFSLVIPVSAAGAGAGLAGRKHWRTAAVGLVPIGFGIIAWYFGVVRPSLTDGLQSFWAAKFATTDAGLRAYFSSMRSLTEDMLGGFLPISPTILGGVLMASALAVAVRRRELVVVLTGPTIVTAVLSTLQLAPLGGLRTDIVLYPSLAVLLAVGLADLADLGGSLVAAFPRRVAFAKSSLVAMVGAALLVPSSPAEGAAEYKLEDAHPLIAHLDTVRDPDDSVLLYYGGKYHYALYADVDFEVFSGPSPFGVTFADPQVVQMGVHRSNPPDYQPYIDEASSIGGRMWYLMAHPCSCDVDIIVDMIAESTGRTVTYTDKRYGASLTLWE